MTELETVQRSGGGRPAVWIAPAVLGLVCAVVFANSLHGPFVYDDRLAILDNPSIRAWPDFWRSMSAPPQSSISGRPVVALTLAMNYAVGGFDVVGYHIVNVAIHFMCALLLFGVLNRVFASDALKPYAGGAGWWISLAAAVLWLVHPINSECVNYTSQRTESVMALFYLGTLYGALRAVDGGRFWLVLSVSACALGMASKESMVTAPVTVVALDWFLVFGSVKEALRRRGSFYLALASCWGLLFLLMASGPRSASVGATARVSTWDYLCSQCSVIVSYLVTLLWPRRLLFDYGFAERCRLADVWPFACIVVLLLVTTAVLLVRRNLLGLVGFWFFVTLSPTSSFVPITSEVGAEPRMYLPSMAVIAAFTVLLYRLTSLGGRSDRIRSVRSNPPGMVPRRMLVFGVAALMVTTLLAGRTWVRNRDYAGALSLWASVLEVAPHNYRAHSTYGLHLELAGRGDEAMKHYETALRLNPKFFDANMNYCNALLARGDAESAIGYGVQALATRPDDPVAHRNLGIALQVAGRSAEAASHFRSALEKQPESPDLMYLLAVSLFRSGASDESIELLFRAVGLRTEFTKARILLYRLLERHGRFSEAVAQLDALAGLDPGDPRWPQESARIRQMIQEQKEGS